MKLSSLIIASVFAMGATAFAQDGAAPAGTPPAASEKTVETKEKKEMPDGSVKKTKTKKMKKMKKEDAPKE